MMATIGSATSDLILHHTELLGQCALQTGRVETCEGSYLSWFQTRVEQGYQTSKVGRVEDDYHVLYIGAELLDVLAKLLGISCSNDVHIVETTLAHLLCNTLWRENVVKTNLSCQTHHQSGLSHV